MQFFNRLYNFYKPKNKVFSSIPYSPANSRKYSRVGYQLVQFLAKDEEVGGEGLHVGRSGVGVRLHEICTVAFG